MQIDTGHANGTRLTIMNHAGLYNHKYNRCSFNAKERSQLTQTTGSTWTNKIAVNFYTVLIVINMASLRPNTT